MPFGTSAHVNMFWTYWHVQVPVFQCNLASTLLTPAVLAMPAASYGGTVHESDTDEDISDGMSIHSQESEVTVFSDVDIVDEPISTPVGMVRRLCVDDLFDLHFLGLPLPLVIALSFISASVEACHNLLFALLLLKACSVLSGAVLHWRAGTLRRRVLYHEWLAEPECKLLAH